MKQSEQAGSQKENKNGRNRFGVKLLFIRWYRVEDCGFFSWDYIGHLMVLSLIALLLGGITMNLSIFSPMTRALDDFSMTDVYYEIQRNNSIEMDTSIVLVDMTKLHNRSEIAQTIREIQQCKPRLLVIDLLFEREGDDLIGNADLISAIDANSNHTLLSCKLTGYNPEKGAFTHQLNSFFGEFGNYHWAYGNVMQKQTGGCIRQYSLCQKMQDEDVYSLPYLAACMYQGKQPHREDMNERTIVYGNTDFPVVACDEVKQFGRLLTDKLVILGTISTEEDSHITPVGKMPGMKIQAYSMLSYMEHHTITQMSTWASLLLAFLCCYLSAWAGYKLYLIPQPVCLYAIKAYYFCIAALLVWASFICFVKFNYNINLLYPLLGIALVEESRIHYKWGIAMLQKYTNWSFPKHSIYQFSVVKSIKKEEIEQKPEEETL